MCMCMCMCIYVYVYIYIPMYVCISTYTYAYVICGWSAATLGSECKVGFKGSLSYMWVVCLNSLKGV